MSRDGTPESPGPIERGEALSLWDQCISLADRLRWKRRLESRERLGEWADGGVPFQEELLSWIEGELFGLADMPEAAAALAQWRTRLQPPVVVDEAASEAALEEARQSAVNEIERALDRLRVPEEAYALAEELGSRKELLGEEILQGLAVAVRERCARLGGNPAHRNFRLLGVARAARRGEGPPPVEREREGRFGRPALTHQPFQALAEVAHPNLIEPLTDSDRLEQEIRSCHGFGGWSKERQRAQLAVWGGQLRKLRADGIIDNEQQRAVFTLLMQFSKTYRPGHVEAFTLRFETEDWDVYIERHRAILEACRTAREAGPESLIEGETLEDATQHLGRLLRLPRDRRHASWEVQVAAQAEHAVQLAGPELEALRPFAEVLVRELRGSPQARAVCRHLRELLPEEEEAAPRAVREDEVALEREEDDVDPAWEAARRRVLAFTRGAAAILLGGDPRIQARDRLQQALELRELDWIEVKSAGGTQLDALKRRVLQGNIDIVLCLARFSQHAFDYKLKDACKEARVPYVVVEHGYGTSRIVSTLAEFYCGWALPAKSAATR